MGSKIYWPLVLSFVTLVVSAGGTIYIYTANLPSNISTLAATLIVFMTVVVTYVFVPKLFAQYTSVIHLSLILSFVHLGAYSFQLRPGQLGSAFVNLILSLLCAAQVCLSSYEITRDNDSWPRYKIMFLFTPEALVLLPRVVLTVATVVLLPYAWKSIPQYAVHTEFLVSTAVILNLALMIELLFSLLWGVTHRKMMGFLSLVSTLLLAVSLIFYGKHIQAGYAMPVVSSWYSLSALANAVHGLLCVFAASAITQIPTIFDRLRQIDDVSTPVDDTLGRTRRSSNTSVSSPQLYDRFFGEDDETEAAPRGKLGLKQLLLYPSVLRNFVNLLLCTTILILSMSYALTKKSQMYIMGWPVGVLVCSVFCSLPRLVSACATSVFWRRPVPDPAPSQVAVSAAVLNALLVVGMIGCFIDSALDSGWMRALLIINGLLAWFLIILKFLHLSGIVRAQKFLTRASAHSQ